EMAVRDRRMPAAEIAGERRPGTQVLGPVDFPGRGVEVVGARRLEARDLEEYAVGEPRLEAGAIRGLERAAERHAGRALPHVGRAQARQLFRQQIRQAARNTRQELV